MPRAVVTGAFSYIGAAVAAELLARGWEVHTLTNRRPPTGSAISASPLVFDPESLRPALEGADAFINTYWVRLPHGGQTFGTAVERATRLFEAAAAAGAGRIVHVSVSNAAKGRNLGYYRGKDDLETRLMALPVPWAIVKPTLVVGPQDVLTANIAWLLRRFPVFPVPAFSARLQPVTLADTARIIADAAVAEGNVAWEAAGPEAMTFGGYVGLVARACGIRRLVLPSPGWLALAGIHCLEPLLRDVLLTREELLGLEQELLLASEPPRGTESVERWLMAQGPALGRAYINDLHRHFGAGAAAPILDPAHPDWR